jgi:release factor glutamine methyltransferase
VIPTLASLLSERGIAILEIGATQREAVTGLAEDAGFTVEIREDLAYRPRAAILT